MIFINLKELRINAGLTQEAAAKMLDLEQSAISHWEQGNTFPLRKKWVHLARIYRCNVYDIETARKERNNGKEEAKPGGPVAG